MYLKPIPLSELADAESPDANRSTCQAFRKLKAFGVRHGFDHLGADGRSYHSKLRCNKRRFRLDLPRGLGLTHITACQFLCTG